MDFFAKSPSLSFEGWIVVFFFSFQITLMDGREGYFPIPYRNFFYGFFNEIVVLLCDEPYWEFRLLLTFLSRGYSCPVSTC